MLRFNANYLYLNVYIGFSSLQIIDLTVCDILDYILCSELSRGPRLEREGNQDTVEPSFRSSQGR